MALGENRFDGKEKSMVRAKATVAIAIKYKSRCRTELQIQSELGREKRARSFVRT
jgi:hypothetical protein